LEFENPGALKAEGIYFAGRKMLLRAGEKNFTKSVPFFFFHDQRGGESVKGEKEVFIMPGMEGTGPMGMGPMTGGGRGWCNPYFPRWGAPMMGYPFFRPFGWGMGFGFTGHSLPCLIGALAEEDCPRDGDMEDTAGLLGVMPDRLQHIILLNPGLQAGGLTERLTIRKKNPDS
jgi:hypothetical protein